MLCIALKFYFVVSAISSGYPILQLMSITDLTLGHGEESDDDCGGVKILLMTNYSLAAFI